MMDNSVLPRSRAGLAVDVVLLSGGGDALSVLVVERRKEPFRARMALPGGFVEPGEDPHCAAVRELAEETGVGAVTLHRLGHYDRPGRDPRGEVVSVAYCGFLDTRPAAVAGSDARAARWVPVRDFLDAAARIAFDHRDIVVDALAYWLRRTARRPAVIVDAVSPGAAGSPDPSGRGPLADHPAGSCVHLSGRGSPPPR